MKILLIIKKVINKFTIKNNKIIWVDWARKQAKYISNCINNDQKLIIRLHRYEIEDYNTLSQINWEKVSRVIFVNSEVEKKFKLLFPKVNTIMIPNAIETTLFKIKLSYMVSKIIKSTLYLLNIKLPNRM